MSENTGREQQVHKALRHLNRADEYRKRRKWERQKAELNRAKAALDQYLHPGGNND